MPSFRILATMLGITLFIAIIVAAVVRFSQKFILKYDKPIVEKTLKLDQVLIIVEKRIMFQEKELNAKNSKIKLQMQDSVKKYTKLLVGKDSINYNWDDMYPLIEN